jgi:hypothetical protein
MTVREGDVRHCQGMVLADWSARTADGQERATGFWSTSVSMTRVFRWISISPSTS